MRNLNVNLAATATTVNSLLVESTCTTPRTPEILNSLIAMTNPLDNYAFGGHNRTTLSSSGTGARSCPTNISSDSNSSSSSPIDSPIANNPPSVQHTCSQLIKAGLKLSIEQKRKHQSDGEDLLDLDKCSSSKRSRMMRNECSESEEDRLKQDGMQNWTWYENDDYSKLTPEDEERRRRRRERNKIAATKCRLKKRERTANLVNESESLETQNVDLKTQLHELQNQKRSLLEIITLHRPLCQNNIAPATRDSLYLQPPAAVSSSVPPTPLDTHSSTYNGGNSSRPASVNASFRTTSQTPHEVYGGSRPASVGVSNNIITYITTPRSNISNNNYDKPPSIIIEEISDSSYQPQLTDLDVSNSSYYNNQCHNYNNQNYSNTSGMDNGCMA